MVRYHLLSMDRERIERMRNGGYDLIEPIERAYEAGEIDADEWHRRVEAIVSAAYLEADNPRAQSGSSRDETGWRQARGLIADAVDRDGTFLDIGCANGHLMETVTDWAKEKGHKLVPYGLEDAENTKVSSLACGGITC